MGHLPTSSRAAPPLGWRFPAVFAFAALGLFAILICHNVNRVASGSDQSGYLNHARLIASGTVHAPARELPGLPSARAPGFLYVPLGFKPAPDGAGLVPTYPVGLPLLIVAAKQVVGWGRAADLVLVLHSLAGLMLTFLLGRMMGLPALWAVLAAAVVAASPLYLFLSLEALSDVPAMVWAIAAVLAAWKGRDRSAWALVAGFALSFSILIRPTNVLAMAPVAIALGGSFGSRVAGGRRWFSFVTGGLPAAIFFCLHSRAAYGRYLTTGYGIPEVDFGMKWIGITFVEYARWLPVLFTPVVAVALGLPWVGRTAPRAATVLGAWITAFLVFYSTYGYTHTTWWELRLILPAAPALVVGGLLGLRLAASRVSWALPPWAAFAMACGIVAAAGAHFAGKLYAFDIPRGDQLYLQAAAWVRANLPADAPILSMQSSGALFYDTDSTLLRWDSIDAVSLPSVMSAIRATHRPLYAVLFPFEVAPALKDRVPGHWAQMASMGQVTIWRRDPD